MNQDKYQHAIFSINEQIEKLGDDWELYYRRGCFYYLSMNEEAAKSDYKQAIRFGLDPTENPYYSFSSSNEMRRDFILPEKILVFLILIIVGIALTIQVAGFVLNVKNLL